MYSITITILPEYIAFNTQKQNYSMRKISTFLQRKTSNHTTLYKICMNKNGWKPTPVEKKMKQMNTTLGTIHKKELLYDIL
jgi:hypothetical protein